jgi:hypothetical protein
MSNVSCLMPLRNSELDLFVLKARKLETSAFWTWINQLPIRADVSRIGAGDWLAYEGLRPEDLDSFCLTFRLLTQDRDGFSIRKIAAQVEAWPTEFDQAKHAVREAVAEMNRQLDRASLISLHDDRVTTKRELFDVIFFGGLAHSDPQKRDVYDRLVNSGRFSQFVFSAFWSALCHYRNCIQTMAHHIAKSVVAAGEHEEGS